MNIATDHRNENPKRPVAGFPSASLVGCSLVGVGSGPFCVLVARNSAAPSSRSQPQNGH